ncbi:MAG: transcription termination/antitermination protein NusG [Syntrophomonadaceae bacterium]|jgi:transcriptional antiterminator NusG|nr:transcription termination/antitermination protein NusG [Syntrophomonadaceae bacterium]
MGVDAITLDEDTRVDSAQEPSAGEPPGQEEGDTGLGERHWYVVHTYSGYENKVRANLEKRVASMGMENQIFQVIIPEEDEVEYKGGQKKVVKRRVFPGYVMVDMILTDDSWYTVRHTPGVTGFVGSGTKPLPLQPDEVERILRHMGMGEARPKIDVQVGEYVRVKSGPFENFEGMVKEILADRGKLRVNISMFGRETPVELDYEQVEKL